MGGINGSDLVKYAEQALGTPYAWGGDSMTKGIDCSGLVQQVYAHFGVVLPRVTYDQIQMGASVPTDKLQPGDLVFFDTDTKTAGPDHVGIYIGGGKFIHAPKTGDVVKVSSLSDSYYMNRLMGTRRISGVVGYNASGSVEAAPQTKLSADELADQYGMSYSFFRSQPELMKLLGQAVSGQWTPDVFTAHLKNTKWWQTNSESARQAQVQAKTDPATYKASIAAAAAQAQEAAVKAGAILSSKQVNQLAHNMVDFAWDDAQISNFLGQYIDFRNGTLGGQAGAAAQQIRTYAYDQGIQVSDQTLKNNAAYIVRGLATMQNVQDSLRQQAISTYPGFTAQLEGGATMRDIAQPYIQMAAQELELPETDIDVWHPKVRAALNAANQAGQPAPMSLSDFQQSLRTDPAWRKTQGAQDKAMAVGRQVLQSMGLVA
jgi:hypothetical protein